MLSEPVTAVAKSVPTDEFDLPRDVEVAVNRLDMVLRCVGADVQELGDLLGAPPVKQHDEDDPLPRSQLGNPLAFVAGQFRIVQPIDLAEQDVGDPPLPRVERLAPPMTEQSDGADFRKCRTLRSDGTSAGLLGGFR